jgi:hypothetical protein
MSYKENNNATQHNKTKQKAEHEGRKKSKREK